MQDFFQSALGINRIPSSKILRQRFDHMSSCPGFYDRIHLYAIELGRKMGELRLYANWRPVLGPLGCLCNYL